MQKVVTFGEIMLRFSTEHHLRFSQAKFFEATYGGSEFNVAVSLVNYGVPTVFVTRIPNNDIGHCALKEMRKFNVESTKIQFGGDRLGVYYLEQGVSSRGSNVVYDRANSSMATIQKGSINWEEVFQGATWFHWSGVTPAISDSAAQVCLEAVIAAHELGVTVSSDLNFRSKLWQYGKFPKDVMPELLQYTNVMLGDLETAFFMLGKEKIKPKYQDKKALAPLYQTLFELCPNLTIAATTLRNSISASYQQIGGILYDGNQIFTSDIKDVRPVVDRVGSGDAFMGGLIYGLLEYNKDLQRTLDFAVAACCLKHTISGDYNLATLQEIEKMLQGDISGKVSR
ncbi:sugar kinase [Gelidibacter salicanalis]|uniref:Sugar kinase n=1 Tax=Gelidibacter salicanalis TaxID=291193 RepID=A0A934KQ88_9FLAO|nr:sugar kinase [Gelidibacter salicanalis]MBJ7880130.1 sugar kinase [Gelidibacter salicanalis]